MILTLLAEKNSAVSDVFTFTFGKLYHSAFHTRTKFTISPILRHYLEPSCNVISNPFLQFKQLSFLNLSYKWRSKVKNIKHQNCLISLKLKKGVHITQVDLHVREIFSVRFIRATSQFAIPLIVHGTLH